MSENYFANAFDENQGIAERFRNIMHDTFDILYSSLGSKNLLRWINERNISNRIKEIAVEEFTKEDLKKKPNTLGYYTLGTNRIRLRDKNNKHTLVHETLHFLTDDRFSGKAFPTFIDEGLTEYLNREFEKLNTGNKEVKYSYPQNVDFVEFLHGVIGDSLIKAYLTGTSQEFAEEFSTYVTKDGSASIKALEVLYNTLNEVHSIKYDDSIVKSENFKERKKYVIENDYPKIREFAGNIVANAIRKKAHDLEYYKDGKLDVDAVVNDIEQLTKKTIRLLEKNEAFGLLRDTPTKEKLELEESIYKNALTAVLQESHISNHEIKDIINKSFENGSLGNEDKIVYYKHPKMNNGGKLSKEISVHSGENPVRDLIAKRLGNKEAYINNGQFNITSFLMDASLVLDKMEIKDDLKPFVLDSIILRYLPQDINHDLVKTMIDKYGKLYVALYQKQQWNKRNVIDSKFVKISDTKFIEKRDNKFYFLDYDEKTGKISEHEMQGTHADRRKMFSKETIDQFGGSVMRITYTDENVKDSAKQDYYVMVNENFSIVTVNRKLYRVMTSPEKLGDSFLIDEVMKPVLDGVNNGKYVTILNDGEAPLEGVLYKNNNIPPDTRSRVINYGLFLKELQEAQVIIPNELQKDIKKTAISDLISRTYLVNPENMKELQDYISGLSLKSLTDDEVAKQLYNFTEILNQSRRKYVKEKSKYKARGFKSEETKRIYRENLAYSQKFKDIEKKAEKFNQCLHGFVFNDSKACIVQPLKVRRADEHYSEMEGIEYDEYVYYETPAASKVDYDTFCNKVKEALADIDEDSRNSFIENVVYDSVRMWYGMIYNYCDLFPKIGELSGELRGILIDRIKGNGKIDDMTKAKKIENEILENFKQAETYYNAVLEKREPLSFENEIVERDYQNIKAIHEMEGISEEAKAQIIKELKANSKKTLDKKRTMDAFVRLALSGEHTPDNDDVWQATRFIDFYKDVEKD